MLNRIGIFAGAFLVGALVGATGDAAGEGEGAAALDGSKLYQERTCIACHGVDAKTPILPDYPKLAGQNKAYMLRQVLDIKNGARTNGNTPAMRGVLHLVNEQEIEAIVDYISKLEP